jgi:hypothetical protein
MGIGIPSMVRRVPMMLGPLVGGWLITRFGWALGMYYALRGCIILSFMRMAFQWLLVEPAGSSEHSPGAPRTIGFVGVLKSFSPTLRELLVSDILIRFCERLPYAWAIVRAINNLGLSPQPCEFLVSLEMITAYSVTSRSPTGG